MFPNNLDSIFITEKNFVGRKKELDNLSHILRRMATRANDSFDVCTVIGIGGQGKVSTGKLNYKICICACVCRLINYIFKIRRLWP